jgi:hypothetical protein
MALITVSELPKWTVTEKTLGDDFNTMLQLCPGSGPARYNLYKDKIAVQLGYGCLNFFPPGTKTYLRHLGGKKSAAMKALQKTL